MVNLNKIVVFVLLFQLNCSNSQAPENLSAYPIPEEVPGIKVGAERIDAYLPLIREGKGGLVVNHTSLVGDRHLVDVLKTQGVDIGTIFAPEHGFRGTADAGEKIKDGLDPETGIPVVSLYGQKRKPAPEDLADLDWVIFDIQDVGARFYTFISSMHYVMEACAENDKPLIILDRPNPNGHYVDGPLRQEGYQSFVGMHPVPVIHGMTVGEYAQMVNGEGWLANGVRCQLKVVTCEQYSHQSAYTLPVKPSPNLPNMRSIYLYPSLCFFEGTQLSIGRGTDKQFQVLGHPDLAIGEYTFTPQPNPGAKYPKLQGKECRGYDLTTLSEEEIRAKARLDLSYLIQMYNAFPKKSDFFLENKWIDKLAGGPDLRVQIMAGQSEEEIRKSWEPGLRMFKSIREKYLLYD
jgi:uncharacterized protein YbbC (DUF1343 family)